MEKLMADEPVLPKRAEQLLAELAVPERDWEEQARAIEARITASELGSTEARWLEAPLPSDAVGSEASTIVGAAALSSKEASSSATTAEHPVLSPTETPFPFDSMPAMVEEANWAPEAALPAAEVTPVMTQPASSSTEGEPAASTSAAAASLTPLPRLGSSQSLSALARSVAQKSGRPQSRDIARESLSVAAAARTKTEAVADRVRATRAAPPPPPSNRSAPSSPPAAASHAKNAQLGPWIALGGLGLAAAVALWVLARPNAPSTLSTSAESPVAIAAGPAAAQVAPPEKMAKALPTPERTAPASAELPVTREAPPATASALPPLAPRVAAASVRAAPAPAAGATSADRPQPEAIVLEDTPSAKVVAAAKATPPSSPSGLRPAAGSPAGGLPDRPATGAVQAALGSVMGPARACVAGGVATPAQVTFAGDGTVQSVAISGANAGSASAACIEGALRRARVAPFANPSFSLTVWVRP
jgi:hypothetical protein